MKASQAYDIIVIGAGPAGSTAAKWAALGGRRVCLLERKDRVGVPVRCGEGIGLKGIAFNDFEVDKRWVKARITKVRMVSPNGTIVELTKGADSYVVDREIMDHDLVCQAVSAGAEYFPNSPVVSVQRAEKKVYECNAVLKTYRAPCIILADGVESRLARDCGWATALDPADIDCCAFCHIAHESIMPDACVFYTGSTITPAGYAWVFPRGKSRANAGIGVLGSHSSAGAARDLLEKLIARHYPGAAIAGMHCGGVPAGKWLSPLVKDGVMIVGDAARQVISLTGAGINYSIFAGKLSGTVAADAFRNGTINYRHLKKYHTIWARGLGKQQLRSYALKTLLVQNHDDQFLNRIAQALSRKKSGRLSILGVFLKTFSRNPGAFLKALLLFR